MVWHVKGSSEKRKSIDGLSRNQSSTMLEIERHLFFIDLDDGEFNEILQNARKKLDVPMEAAMPCKLRTKKRPNKLREADSETK